MASRLKRLGAKIGSLVKSFRKTETLYTPSGQFSIPLAKKLAKRANQRMYSIERENMKRGLYSPAYEEAITSGGRFHFRKNMTEEELNIEATRMFIFLSNPTSTLRGARLAEASRTTTLGMWGKEFLTKDWRHPWSKDIDLGKDEMSVIYRAYRKVESLGFTDQIYNGYGSENLISLLYDYRSLEGKTEDEMVHDASKVLNEYYIANQERNIRTWKQFQDITPLR